MGITVVAFGRERPVVSNLLLNIRFGSWHWQVSRDRPWLRVGRNPYHDKARLREAGWRWFEIH